MDSKILHNMKDTPFNERESFNNAILLLSMVKSEYYYIVSFSRPKNQIEIGFDFSDEVYGSFSETVTMDFSGNSTGVVMFTQLSNIFFEGKSVIPFNHNDNFKIVNGIIYYKRLFEKDDVIPISMEKLNTIILTIKEDILKFFLQSVSYILKKHRSNKWILKKIFI